MHARADLIAELEPSDGQDTPGPSKAGPGKHKRKGWVLGGVALLLLLGTGLGLKQWVFTEDASSWRSSEVTLSDLKQTVSSTGTLEAVTTVDVGTQVSGRITALLVDYNDDVQAGQLLAQIDPVLLQAEVDSARATLTQRRASAALAEQELARTEFLAGREAATAQELQIDQAESVEARALVQSAQVALARAERNLEYATIVSPIQGTVVDRVVEVGQTVNAGTSAPTLYTLVGDLDEMQILATVDEADIGLVQPGQATSFTVQAWPERTFEGTVRKVRLQSTTTDSVVTYTAVIDVPNSERLLLPGMTASVDFVVAQASSVLAVPSAALRFTPDASDLPAAGPPGGGSPNGERSKSGGKGGGKGGRSASGDTVWVLDDSGGLRPIPVQVGLSDGSKVQVSGEGLEEGLMVVTGQLVASEKSSSASPFQGESESKRGPGGPGGF